MAQFNPKERTKEELQKAEEELEDEVRDLDPEELEKVAGGRCMTPEEYRAFGRV